MKTRIIIAVSLIFCLFAVTACSGNSSKALTGKYVIADIKDDPEGTTIGELRKMYKNMDADIKDYMYMEFTDSGSYTLVMFGEKVNGRYTRSENGLTLTSGNETYTG